MIFSFILAKDSYNISLHIELPELLIILDIVLWMVVQMPLFKNILWTHAQVFLIHSFALFLSACYLTDFVRCWGCDGNHFPGGPTWLGLRASTAGGAGLILGQGTKVPHAAWTKQKMKRISKGWIQTNKKVKSSSNKLWWRKETRGQDRNEWGGEATSESCWGRASLKERNLKEEHSR